MRKISIMPAALMFSTVIILLSGADSTSLKVVLVLTFG